jgi:hypothetical protein
MSFADNAAAAIRRPGFGTRGLPQGEGASDEVLAVLEAANDLGDGQAVAACRRIIEANKTGAPIAPADMQLVLTYFR